MNIAPEWTANNIKAELRLAHEDLAAEQRVTDTLTDRRDIVAAYARVRDIMGTITLFEQRLEAVEKRDAEKARVQAETRARCEQERDDATAEHAELDSAFESEMLDLERHIFDRLDTLIEIAVQRGNAETKRSNAVFELRGRQVDWSNTGQLSDGFGWYSNATPDARSDVRKVLFELYAVRRRLYGTLQLPGQDDGFRPLAYRTPQIDEPDQDDAFRAQVVAEFAQKRAQNGS